MNTTIKLYGILLIKLSLILLTSSIYSQTGWVIQNTGTTANLSRVYFIDVNSGLSGNPSIKTTNGGLNWIADGNTPQGYQIVFVNNNTGYYAVDSTYKTTNGGNSWFSTGGAASRRLIYFINRDTGFTAGRLESMGGIATIRVMKTINGGTNWNVSLMNQPFDFISNSYSALCFSPSNTGYVAEFFEGQNEQVISRIYRTTDLGSNWSSMYSSDSLYFKSMQFPDAVTGYCIGEDVKLPMLPLLNTILKCTSGSWQIIYTTPMILKSLFFINSNTGYAVGDTGRIIKTTNGGSNWTILNSGTSQNLNSIYFVNQLTGFIAGNSGVILKTTTGGVTPVFYSVSGIIRYQDNLEPVTSGKVKALKYNYATHEITVVDSAVIQSNGSYILPHCPPDTLDIMGFQDDEEEQLFVPTYYISTIYWENSTKIYLTGNMTNININVFRINNPSPGLFHIGGNVYSYGETETASLKDAIIYAKSGNVFKGYSVSQNTGAYCIDLLASANYELICSRMGYNSSIRPLQVTSYSMDTVNFSLSLMLVKIEDPGNIIPGKFSLFQNYPNPFNPATKIKFSVPADGKVQKADVQLIIYNPLGQQISVLVNQQLLPGVYETEWDASGYSSGIYFYKLESGDYSETKIMVLIK